MTSDLVPTGSVAQAGGVGVSVGVTAPGLGDVGGAVTVGGGSGAVAPVAVVTPPLTSPVGVGVDVTVGVGTPTAPVGVGVGVTTPVLGGTGVDVTLGGGTSTAPGGVGVGVTTPVLGGTGVDVTLGGGTSTAPGGVGVGVTTPVLGGTGVDVTLGGGASTTPGGGGVTTPGTGGGNGVDVTVSTGTSPSTGTGGSGGGAITVGAGGGSTPVTSPGGGGGGGGVGDPTGGSGVGVGVGASGTPDPQSAYVNIFRLASAADIPAAAQTQLTELQRQVNTGAITATQAVLKVADMAVGATSVAETSYQFFSGLTPSADGLGYLVHSPANPTDLSDSYYTAFNLENRYINFASNLGLHSDYAPEFAKVYGSMTFQDAVATAYDRIIGTTQATAAGIDYHAAIADIVSRQPYFQAVAHERFGVENQDLSTKLAAVAYIMEESVRADVGRYGQANQNFLFDLADGHAQHHVDLVGVYGAGGPVNMTTS